MTVNWVNVYSVSRCYGGPEEGGWWYDAGECIERMEVAADKAGDVAEALRRQYPRTGRRYSVLGGDDFDVKIEHEPGTYFPQYQPRYE